jgi:4-hydroxybenzoate polyprenyltransferase
VRRLALLGWLLLRYRFAARVALFMLLGAARGPGLDRPWALVLAACALGAAYVAATAVNDVADEPIDRVNHQRDPGRPLVSGAAGVEDLWRLHVLAGVLALGLSVPLGPLAVALVAASLAIGQAYSLSPLALSYRTWAAPAVLSIGYVAVPYALGVTVAGGALGRADAPFAAALVALFVARVVLKDFRDRAGDMRYGRSTLVLRFGKEATCAASAGALAAGGLLLLLALRPPLAVAVVLVGLLAAAAWAVAMVRQAASGPAELIAIALGARMGDGILLAALAWLVVVREAAGTLEQVAAVSLVGAAFAVGFATLVARPKQAIVGYKG